MLQGSSLKKRERERQQDTGTKALMEQRCFIQHCVDIYTVLQDSYFQQKVKESESEVAQSCPTLCDPADCSLPGFSDHGTLQARILGGGCHFLLQGISLKKREREREREKDMGTKALMEQGCFIQHCVGIYTVLQDSYFQQRQNQNLQVIKKT